MKAFAKNLAVLSIAGLTTLAVVQDATAWWGGNDNDNWDGGNYYGGPGAYGRPYGGGYPPPAYGPGYGGAPAYAPGYGVAPAYPPQSGYAPAPGYAPAYAPAPGGYGAPAAPAAAAPAPAPAPRQSYGSYGSQGYDATYGDPPPSGAPDKAR